MKFVRLPVLVAMPLMFAACSEPPPPAPTVSDPAPPTNRIDIPPTVRKNLGITFARVERRRVESTIRVPGAFELRPLARHEYHMSLPGTVDLAVDQYQRVEPGDVLYRFRSPSWPELQHEIITSEQAIDAAKAEIAVAIARVAEAEQTLAIGRGRLAALADADVRLAALESAVAELDASVPRLRAEEDLARTRLASARRTLDHAVHRAGAASGIDLERQPLDSYGVSARYRDIDWIDVRAADAGIVEQLAVTDGAFIESASLVLSTVDPEQLRFRALALQSDLARLAGRTSALIVPPASAGIDLVDAVPAEVGFGLEAHPQERTMTLLASPAEGRVWMRPGVSAFLEVVVDSTVAPALAIPRAAIVRDGLVHVFFRRDPEDPNRALRVEADMGVSDGRWVAIHSGLGPDDEVVLDGVYELKLASQASGLAQPGGHFHADGTFHSGEDD